MAGAIIYDKRSKRYYVKIYWGKHPYRIWKYKEEPIYGLPTAKKLLNKIRAEIDDKIFNPRTYFPDSPLSLSIYADKWLKASTAIRATKVTYRKAIERAVKCFGGDFDIRHFTYSRLMSFYNEIEGSQKTKYNTLATLRTMLRFALKDEVLKKLPPFPALNPGVPEETDYLTFEEQAKILTSIPERHRPIFEMMMEYGLRPQEARALKWDCIKDGKIIFKRSFSEYKLRETTKTGKIRTEDITTRCADILKRAKENISFKGFVFCHNKRGTPYDGKRLRIIWRDACNKAGIHIKMVNGVRHSLGCQLADAGYSIDFIQDVYKHTSLATTRRYAKRKRAAITEALENRGRVIEFTDQILTKNRGSKT